MAYAGVAKLAADRLSSRRGIDWDGRVASAREAMVQAMVRLDRREARRQAEVLHSMGAGVRTPMSPTEEGALRAKLERLIAEANARVSAQEKSQ